MDRSSNRRLPFVEFRPASIGVDIRAGTQTVYCDESGFTGNNLLDSAQPLFVYSAVAIDPAEAEQLIAIVEKTIAASGAEIKGSSLVGTFAGRRLLSEILAPVASRSVVSVSDKKFALACKFFEYVFEPALAANSGFFYSIGFNRFVANLLNVALVTHDVSAEDAIAAFQKFMRSRKISDIEAFLGAEIGNSSSAWRVLSNFALAYREKIRDEVAHLNDWTLDLSTTALHSCLVEMGGRFESLDVYCDRSEPIRRGARFFDSMIGNTNQTEIVMGSRVRTLTYNLANSIHVVDSHTHAGIQIADFVATSISWALRGPENKMRPEVLTELWPLLDVKMLPIVADRDLLDTSKKEVVMNGLLLAALDERAQRAADPLDGIVEEYLMLSAAYDVSPPAGCGPAIRPVKIGRNEICDCGSGLKYKRCCGSV